LIVSSNGNNPYLTKVFRERKGRGRIKKKIGTGLRRDRRER
jgi:hypothetical protein